MDLLEDLKMSLLNSNFVMIYIIHKMLVLLKNHLNYVNDSIIDCFFKEYNRFCFFNKFLTQHIMMESLSFDDENVTKTIRNRFILEKKTKEIKDRILRDIKNHFEHEEA